MSATTRFLKPAYYKESDILERFRRVWRTGNSESACHLSDRRATYNWREYYVYRLPSMEIVAISICDGKENGGTGAEGLAGAAHRVPEDGNHRSFCRRHRAQFQEYPAAISGNTEYLNWFAETSRMLRISRPTSTTRWKKAWTSSTTCCIFLEEAEVIRRLPLTSLM